LPNEDTVLLSPDGRVEVHFPAGAVSRRMRAAFAPQRSKTTDELFYVFQLEMRNLRSQPTAVSFSQPVRVVFHYTKEDLDGLVTPHLRLYRLDEETGDWWPVHGVIDEEAQTLTTHLDHFSIYGIGPSFIRYIPLSMEDWPPSLPITKTASSSTFQAGQLVTYTLTISNPADSTAHFTVTDKLAAGFVYNAELGCDWGKSPGLTGGSPLNLREDGTVLEWTVFDLVAEGTGVLSYTVYAGERAKPLSCNHVVVDPTEGGFTSSRDTHCLWRDLAWWNEGYAYRQPLLINAVQQITATGTSAIEIPLGLVFDTGSLVDEGKLASDGRDLRVVYWGDAGWEELPREIQGLDSITSTLWFPLQDTIEQGLSGDYYVYYGNPWPDSPTQAITQVFGTSSELVAHLNGETTGSEGETGTIGGSGFSWVAEESGYTPASITNTATLTYSHSGAIVPAHGTVALHVKPSWESDDETTHYLFQAGQAGSDRLEIYKNSSAEMRFKVVAGEESYEVTEDADLVSGGWSSIVATWDDDTHEAHLYQKGEGTNSATITNTVSGTLDLWLGSQAGGGASAEALMANLFVYDQALTQGQAESLHRSLLWADILPQDEEWRGVTSTVTITYQYDPLYRLTGATYSGGAEYHYTYDAVGNRQIMDSPDGEVSYTYDAANRLTSVDGVTYTWDDNGNLTSDGVRSYTYDHADRLTQVTQGSQTTQYAYNGDGDRTSKTVSGDTTQYVLDLAATLPVVVSDTEAVYLYGLDIIAQQQSERQYYFHDALGSVRQLLDSTGEVDANYAYDPFGVPVVAGDATNPYRFTGEAWDEEVELLYLRARYYQPDTGRFITKDPWVGNVWQPSTLNRYVYASNNPVNYVDPAGLQDEGPLDQKIGEYINDLIERSGLWLRDLVETDPLVNHVYQALRISLETRFWQRFQFRSELRETDPGRLSAVDFLCEAVREARISMYRNAPALCSGCSDHDCNKLTVRVALRALAAVVRWVGDEQWDLPRIPFETETGVKQDGTVARVRLGRNKIMNYALPEITSPYLDPRLHLQEPPVNPRLGQTSEFDQYTPEEVFRYDKTYHFFTAALIAYELRWNLVPASGVYTVTDWAGRAFESVRDTPDNPYSWNDVVANRWGALFGITFFDDPDRLVRVCVGWGCCAPHHPGCI
jgi:RHS repeat-associated protein/uncharacterized repeat protein (TIGR01451 family)